MMRFLSVFLLLACSLVWIAPADAQVILDVSKNIRVLAANGEETPDRKKLRLDDGVSQIVVRLEGEINVKNIRDSDLIYSDTYVLKFTAENETVTLDAPKIRREYDMTKFDINPNFSLMSSSGSSVPYQIDELKKEGLQIMRDYPEELAEFNKSNSPAAVAPGEGIANKNAVAGGWNASEQGVSAADQSVAENMLKYWYQQADDETRQRFWQWISE